MTYVWKKDQYYQGLACHPQDRDNLQPVHSHLEFFVKLHQLYIQPVAAPGPDEPASYQRFEEHVRVLQRPVRDLPAGQEHGGVHRGHRKTGRARAEKLQGRDPRRGDRRKGPVPGLAARPAPARLPGRYAEPGPHEGGPGRGKGRGFPHLPLQRRGILRDVQVQSPVVRFHRQGRGGERVLRGIPHQLPDHQCRHHRHNGDRRRHRHIHPALPAALHRHDHPLDHEDGQIPAARADRPDGRDQRRHHLHGRCLQLALEHGRQPDRNFP